MASKDCPYYVVACSKNKKVTLWRRGADGSKDVPLFSWEPKAERFEKVSEQTNQLKDILNRYDNALAEQGISLVDSMIDIVGLTAVDSKAN